MTDPALATAASLQQKLEAERQRVAYYEAIFQRLLDREDLRWAITDEVARVVRDALKR